MGYSALILSNNAQYKYWTEAKHPKWGSVKPNMRMLEILLIAFIPFIKYVCKCSLICALHACTQNKEAKTSSYLFKFVSFKLPMWHGCKKKHYQGSDTTIGSGFDPLFLRSLCRVQYSNSFISACIYREWTW